jgi:N-acetylglucosaminyl-diphospho-decaprenol L-rhamnosyltransferase
MRVRASPELSLVVVHWRAEADLAALLAAVPADPRWEVVVVDNGGSARALTATGDVVFARSGSNLGFAGGANLGIAVARAPLVLLLNPDVVPQPGALEALLAGFAAWPDVAALAPRLLGADGAPQAGWQLRPLPSAGELLAHCLLFDPRRAATVEEPAAGAAVEQPAAAALALRRSALERVGGLDPRFHPAWFEDVDLARRLRLAGETMRYWPQAAFTHRLAGSVAPLGYAGFLWCYHRNLGRYLRRHHGVAWELLSRAVLVVAAPLRAALLPLRRPRRAAGRGAALAALGALALGAATGWRWPRRLASGGGWA